MVSGRVERRLAAILAADVVGYSRLIGEDEEGVIARLKAQRDELIEPRIAGFRGHIVKTTGDGILAAFPSVVDAVRSAVAIQRNIAKREAAVPEAERLIYRIGVNLGDVVIDGADILGDGVNVAARLEGLADPGGISISGNVFQQVEGKLDIGFEDRGEQQVKNIENPIHVYRVLLKPEAAGTVIAGSPPPKPKRSPIKKRAAAAGAAAVVVIVAAVAWWQPWREASVPPPPEVVATPVVEKISIAVLPFDNFSDEPARDYFAEGMSEDLITDLSKLSALFVVPSDTSFRFKNRTIGIQQVGRQLGVRYLLDGSVRRAGDQVRINAQLIDAETGGQIWAERYDGKLANTFALQDQVTRRIIDALSLTLGADELAKLADNGTNNFEAHDAFLKGQGYARRYTPIDFARAIEQYERALELDPNYTRAAEAIEQVRYIQKNSGLK